MGRWLGRRRGLRRALTERCRLPYYYRLGYLSDDRRGCRRLALTLAATLVPVALLALLDLAATCRCCCRLCVLLALRLLRLLLHALGLSPALADVDRRHECRRGRIVVIQVQRPPMLADPPEVRVHHRACQLPIL
jgi:hypothetical protein